MKIKIIENTRYKVLFIEDSQLDQMAFKASTQALNYLFSGIYRL